MPMAGGSLLQCSWTRCRKAEHTWCLPSTRHPGTALAAGALEQSPLFHVTIGDRDAERPQSNCIVSHACVCGLVTACLRETRPAGTLSELA